ncbi:hypothetical protein ABK040_002940 [Willaertia magna]
MSKLYLQGIVDNVKLAREHALLGNYSASLGYFEGVIEQIDSYLMDTVVTIELRSKWTQTKQKLKQEAQIIQNIQAEINAFSSGLSSCMNSNSNVKQKPVPKFFEDQPEKSTNGGCSFTVNTVDNENRVRTPSTNISPEYDPDVWAPPTPHNPVVKKVPPKLKSAIEKPQIPRRVVNPSKAIKPNRGNVNQVSKENKDKNKKLKTEKENNSEEEATPSPQEPPKFVGSAQDKDLIEMIEKDILDRNFTTNWKDVVGLSDVINLLEEAAVYPMLLPNFFNGIREPWKGILLFGPPGTGKTTLAKAVATECKTTFFNVSVAGVTSKWRGESEKLIRLLFEMARFYAPSTIFIDEIDALCGKRSEGDHEASRRVKTELLVQMDGIHSYTGTDSSDEGHKRKTVLVLGATNHPWDLDDALRRRLEKRIYIPLPDFEGRKELFKLLLEKIILAEDVDLDELSKMTEGYSPADIRVIVRDASMAVFRRARANREKLDILDLVAREEEISKSPVLMEDFRESIKRTSPSVCPDDIDKYQKWMETFGSK